MNSEIYKILFVTSANMSSLTVQTISCGGISTLTGVP